MKWIEWRYPLINLLRAQPGRNGVQLNYAIRENNAAIIMTNIQFLDDYLGRAPITEKTFAHDVLEVHTYIVTFTTETFMAENKLISSHSLLGYFQ